MRILNSIAAMALACAAGTAAADSGLRVDGAGGFWYGTQTRLSVHAVRADATPVRLGYQTSAGLSGIAPMAAAVSGDYYFSKDLADATSPRTGFRASSVLLIRQPGISLSDLAWSSRAAVSFGTSHGVALPSLFPGLVDSSADNASAMPYLGIGYSDVSKPGQRPGSGAGDVGQPRRRGPDTRTAHGADGPAGRQLLVLKRPVALRSGPSVRTPPRRRALPYKDGLNFNGLRLVRNGFMSDSQQRIDQVVKNNRVVLFMKGTAQFPMCGFSGRAMQLLNACGVNDVKTVNVLEDEEIRQGIKQYANWPTIPQLYVDGEFVGGSDIMTEMYQSGELQQVLGKN
jgi:monothiol glutaredoxin